MINKKIVMILEDDIDLAEGIELSLKVLNRKLYPPDDCKLYYPI